MVYFDKALQGTNSTLIGTMRDAMKGTRYDTIVGTGLSGTIFTARVAPGLRKKFAIVRKHDDKSTHSGNRIEGTVGKRWVFADDFVSGGTTLKRVLNKMKEIYPESEFVGVYQSEGGDFSDPDESSYRWGNWVTELSIGVKLGPKTLDEVRQNTPWDTQPLKMPLDGWPPKFRALIPMSDRRNLTVDYPDGYGRPTLYDGPQRLRWTCEDTKALPYIEEVENVAASMGISLRRMVGERMDRLTLVLITSRRIPV